MYINWLRGFLYINCGYVIKVRVEVGALVRAAPLTAPHNLLVVVHKEIRGHDGVSSNILQIYDLANFTLTTPTVDLAILYK